MKRAGKLAVEALRSGKYKQGRDFLTAKHKNSGESDCCLGVISKICPKAPKATWTPVSKNDAEDGVESFIEYKSNHATLSESVQNWIGFKTDIGTFNFSDLRDKHPLLAKQIEVVLTANGRRRASSLHVSSLAELNDHSVPFTAIAAVIEAEPEGLFK